jgi:hypothetical protein
MIPLPSRLREGLGVGLSVTLAHPPTPSRKREGETC